MALVPLLQEQIDIQRSRRSCGAPDSMRPRRQGMVPLRLDRPSRRKFVQQAREALMKSSLSTVVAASTLALLSACGGGGGDSPSQGDGKVTITSANQDEVVRASVTAGLSVSTTQ